MLHTTAYYIHLFAANRTLLIVYPIVFCFDLENKNHEILDALQYKPLYNISRSEKWGKKLQAKTYNGARVR